MNPNQTNQPMNSVGSQMPPMTPMMPTPEKKGIGGIIVVIIVILVLLGAGYFLMEKMEGGEMMDDKAPNTQGTADAEGGAGSLPELQAAIDPNTVQGTSIDLSEIEKDLSATELESLVADLNAI